MPDKYDVVVVGAGPAGSSAARAAAERGARTIVLEEHRVVGYPRHCGGRLDIPDYAQDVFASLDKRLIISQLKCRRLFSPSGKMVREIPVSPERAYFILREEFDRSLARQAVEAGAHLVLNTQVAGLLKEGERIIGVTTRSRDKPVVYGRVVIAAQGGQGRRNGIPRQESMCNPGETFRPGILFVLAGIHDLEAGTSERHLGNIAGKEQCNIAALDNRTGQMVFPTADIFASVKKGDSPVSRKLRDAQPIQMCGYAAGSGGGLLPKVVKDGLMLVGDSAGYRFIINAILSGRCAGQTAAAAVREGDVSKGRLKGYPDLCQEVGLPFAHQSQPSLKNLNGLSDEAIEARLREMV